jgi:glycine/D-amino acid oxidase-like deaminating enzyme
LSSMKQSHHSKASFDTIIIGGGFYGLRIAQYLREELNVKRVLIIEKESQVMQRASYNNQARVHNGYHYPRSVLTALRSRVNLPIFSKEYEEAIVDDFDKYYGVATTFSKVSATQFERFFQRIGAEILPAPDAQALFNPKLIERVFKVKEHAFNTLKLKEKLLNRLSELDVVIHTAEEALELRVEDEQKVLVTDKGTYKGDFVLNTTYSSINLLNQRSHLPIIPLKHELTEMCLVTIPAAIQDMAFTIMCGPFFSLMPFPAKGLHTLSHVRYTPHNEWTDADSEVRNGHSYLANNQPASHFIHMISDVRRYMPLARDITYTGESLWEVKTVLPQSEADDSRPIMYLKNHGGIRGYICIMGGKIDNIYDVFKELNDSYEKAV